VLSRLKQAVRSSTPYAPIRRQRLRNLAAKPGVYPDWRVLLSRESDAWKTALAAAKTKRILIATHVGLHFTANTIDSLLAIALTFRGAEVDVLLCDGALSACMIAEYTLAPSVERFSRVGPAVDFCAVCQTAGARLYRNTGVNVLRLSDFLTEADREEARMFATERSTHRPSPAEAGPLGEHALAGALRFFGRSALPGDETSSRVYERYLEGSMQAARASARLLAAKRYDAVIVHHGIYVPQGLLAVEARQRGLRLVTWHPAYRRGRLIFQHGDTYHRAMLDEPASSWARVLSGTEDAALEDYLSERITGASDWIAFQRSGPLEGQQVFSALGLDATRPVYTLLANVAWDARLHYPASAYGDMRDWAVDTVRWFAARPDRQLVVRCHPGEVLGNPKAKDRLDDAIQSVFPALPTNVRIVAPEDELNSYSIAAISRGAMIFNTKMGMELAARGMPVVVAGDAWIRGKGFSRDASSPEAYLALLENPATFTPLTEKETVRARQYAYHFFFRRCVPVAALAETANSPLTSLRPDAATLARPGQDKGLDVICDGVLNGTMFEYCDG
jgi:hypothetical protein